MLLPLLFLAGVSEVGRAGIIVRPLLGMNFNASAILTDMPLASDKSMYFRLQDFYRHCNMCAEMCRSRSIPKDWTFSIRM